MILSKRGLAAVLMLGMVQPAWADSSAPGSALMIANPGAGGPPFLSKPASDTVPVPVKIIGSPALCAGCATSGNQLSEIADLNQIVTNTTGAALDASIQQLLTKLNAGLTVSWSGQSVGISGTLPAFAATPTFNLGTIGTAATAANQAFQITQETATATASGTPADTAYAGSGSSSIIAALKGIYAKLAGSIAVTGTFWQATQPVSLSQTTPGTTNGVVVNNGSTGLDFSANKPTLPNVGSAFAASGPYASYVLLVTVPASATRANVDVENDSGAQIAIVRDDGTAAGGTAPVNASVFGLSGGTAAGSQGGSWSSTTFRGRLQIYAPGSTAQVSVMVE